MSVVRKLPRKRTRNVSNTNTWGGVVHRRGRPGVGEAAENRRERRQRPAQVSSPC